MMRGYIGLSRATDAEGVLIARPFSPELFNLGPQPFATLLLETLQGRIPDDTLTIECDAAAKRQRNAKENRMDTRWTCATCTIEPKTMTAKQFLAGLIYEEEEEEQMAQIVFDENISSRSIQTLFNLRPSWQQKLPRMRQLRHWEEH